jgi:hypothetical protein
MEDCDYLKKHTDELIVINDTWRMVSADYLYAADQRWWNMHYGDLACGFTGKRYSCETPNKDNWGKHNAEEWHVELLECITDGRGLSTDPTKVVGGGNSGYQAINLALHLAKGEPVRIILLGYDMSWDGSRAHRLGNHPAGLMNVSPEKYITNFRTIKPEKYGLEIINCSRRTKLDAFPLMRLEDI